MTGAGIEYLVCDVSAVREAHAHHPWLASLLSAAEVERSDRLRHASDRTAYRCAHLVLRLITARRLGLDAGSAGGLNFMRRCRSCGGSHGKPQVARAGADVSARTGAEVSLSRSGTMLLLASAPPSSPIGVDIEGVPNTVFPGFDEYVLAPGESAAGCADTDRKRLELWVAKEAALKTTGHGLSVEPHKLEVVRTGDEVSVVDVTDVWTSAISAPEHAELDRLNLMSVPCRPSHAAALSCADRLPVTSLKLTDLLSG